MSYSFSVRAENKKAAIEAVTTEMVKVVTSQNVHVKDCMQAVAAATAYINILDDDPSCDVTITVSGSVSWDTPDIVLRWASVNISAALRTKGKE